MVRQVKESLCYHALDFKAALETARTSATLDKSFELPDGNSLTLGSERLRASEVPRLNLHLS